MQVDTQVSTTQTARSLLQSSSTTATASFTQHQSQQLFASAPTYQSQTPPDGGLLTKLKSRAAASMLGGEVVTHDNQKLTAVPSKQDQLSSAHMRRAHGNVQSSVGHPTAMPVSPHTGDDMSLRVPLTSSGVGSSTNAYVAVRPMLLQNSAQLAVTSGPSKAQPSGPLFQAMLEQSTSDRAQQFAREGSLAVAAAPIAANNNAAVNVSRRLVHKPAEHANSDGERSNPALSRRMPEGANLSRIFSYHPIYAPVHASHQSCESAGAVQDARPRVLPQVKLTAADEETVFGLTVRLQYAENELEVITVLQELAFCIVLDIPPAAILQRNTLLDTVMELMASSSASDTIRHLAMHFLHSLVIQTKQALQEADDPEQCPLYDGADPVMYGLHPDLKHAYLQTLPLIV